MSMSTHVCGIKPPDAKWSQMKAAYDACIAAGVPVPKVVDDFFGGERPDPSGVLVYLDRHASVREYKGQDASGYEIDLKSLPPDVAIIRVVNSW